MTQIDEDGKSHYYRNNIDRYLASRQPSNNVEPPSAANNYNNTWFGARKQPPPRPKLQRAPTKKTPYGSWVQPQPQQQPSLPPLTQQQAPPYYYDLPDQATINEIKKHNRAIAKKKLNEAQRNDKKCCLFVSFCLIIVLCIIGIYFAMRASRTPSPTLSPTKAPTEAPTEEEPTEEPTAAPIPESGRPCTVENLALQQLPQFWRADETADREHFTLQPGDTTKWKLTEPAHNAIQRKGDFGDGLPKPMSIDYAGQPGLPTDDSIKYCTGGASTDMLTEAGSIWIQYYEDHADRFEDLFIIVPRNHEQAIEVQVYKRVPGTRRRLDVPVSETPCNFRLKSIICAFLIIVTSICLHSVYSYRR